MMDSPPSYLNCPWRLRYEPGVSPTISYENKLLPTFLDETATRFPEKTALVFEGFRLGYSQLQTMVDRAAGALSGLGIRRGARRAAHQGAPGHVGVLEPPR
jgi:long-chain acyl-CoA synthetase